MGGSEGDVSDTKEQYKEPMHVLLGRPRSFADLGKQAKDLLYKGFSSGHMLMVSCVGPGGLVLSSTATVMQGSVIGMMSTTFSSAGIQSEISGSTLSQISASTTYENIAPGLKATLTTVLPGANELGKAQVHYQLNNAALDATVFGLKSKPMVQVSANVGSERLSLGGSAVYNTATREVTGTNLGLGYLRPDFSAGLLYDPFKENMLDAYLTHVVNPHTTIGGHVNYKLENQVTSTTFGGSHRIDLQTTVRARFDNSGVLAAVLEHQPNPFLTFGMYADVDTTNLQTRKPNIGLTVSILAAVS
ncbi:unnamed protein product [Calypogeia fissa]